MGEGKVITGCSKAAQRLDKALAEASGLSRERVKALMREGRVTIGGKQALQASANPSAETLRSTCRASRSRCGS